MFYTPDDILPSLNEYEKDNASRIAEILNFIEQKHCELSLNDISKHVSNWVYSQTYGSFILPMLKHHRFVTVQENIGYDRKVIWTVNPKEMWIKNIDVNC